MGIGIGVDEVDIIAHEFTHFVSRSIVVDWIGGNETSSINEALSDIFGEIIESKGQISAVGTIISAGYEEKHASTGIGRCVFSKKYKAY